MYVKHIQIVNYGPIDQIEILFPFDGTQPKPVILVGPNGSGKSIFLSHIVNSLLSAKGNAYPQSPEVETGKVYKFRSPQYIASGKDFSFARVDFKDGFWTGELQINRAKKDFANPPAVITNTNSNILWDRMKEAETSIFYGNGLKDRFRLKELFSSNCVLYFPPDRYEDPAWLNETNLLSKAAHLDLSHLEGYTERKIINYSPLNNNQNWLFSLVYDFSVFERHPVTLPVLSEESGKTFNVTASIDYQGHARQLYNTVLSIIQEVIDRKDNVTLDIGPRHNRAVSLMSGTNTLVPNIFQLASGEVSLLNLFLSILRDCDLSDDSPQQANDIKGVVIVDEIDLHLHSRHQYKILPNLIRMFPHVQFIVTSHSPLFILGLQNSLGEDKFALYNLPDGQRLSVEDFSEFGVAYKAFVDTQHYTRELRSAVKSAQQPLVFVEGPTDVLYMKKAAKLLGFQKLLEAVEFRGGRREHAKKYLERFN